MTSIMTSAHTPRPKPASPKSSRHSYLTLRPGTVRALAVAGIGGQWGYFLLKFFFGDKPAAALLIGGGILELGAIGCMLLVFFSSYSFIANAPDREIDERELAQRYRAYFYAYQYVIGGLILGSIGAELVEKVFGAALSAGVVNNFIWTMIFTAFVMPAAFLAWWDREEY